MRNALSDELASYIFHLMEGDTSRIGDMYDLLKEYGYCDEYGEQIYDDDESEESKGKTFAKLR